MRKFFDARRVLILTVLLAPPALAERGELLKPAKGGDAGTVKILIEAGADLNERTGTGRTALISAARKGRADITDALTTAGASQ